MTRTVGAAVTALVTAWSVTILAGPPQSDIIALSIAHELCKGMAPGGPSIEVIGPNVRWAVPAASMDTKAEMVAFIRRARAARGVLIEANGAWVAVHEIDARATVLLNCFGGDPFSTVHDFRTAAIAVSHAGDLALRTDTGDVMLAIRPTASKTPRSWSAPTNQSRANLLWLDRRLIVLGRDRTFALDVTGTGYRMTPLPVSGLPETIDAVWAYRGLTFVLANDGCMDLLVDVALTPHLPHVACIPTDNRNDGFLGFDPVATRVFSASAEVIWEGSRLLALSARLGGTVREVTANLHSIARAPWTPTVPVMFGDAERKPPTTTKSRGDSKWAKTIVRPELWSSPQEFDSGLATIDQKGWLALRDDGDWSTGTGVAVRWETGPEFVTPNGRTLTALARELYYQQKYADDEIDDVMRANAAIGRSLEGRLFDLGWIPVGAAFGPTDQPPLALTGVGTIGGLITDPKRTLAGPARTAVEPFKLLKSAAGCRLGEAIADETVMTLVRNGIGMLGRSGVSSRISKSTNPQLKAASAVVVRCVNAAGVPLRLLVLGDVAIDSDEGRAKARAGEKIDGAANDLTFSATDDASWPVGIQQKAIVAVGLEKPIDADARVAFLRPWLDDLFRHGRINRALIQVSYLELVMAVNTDWQPRTETLPKVRLIPLERVSAAARGIVTRDMGCTTEASLLDQQKQFHDLLSLTALPPTERVADVPMVGIVETAVMRSDPVFKRTDGTSVWMFLNSTKGRFDPFTDETPVPADAASLHGTRVAGLLYSTVPPTGVLSNARLTWIDDALPKREILTKLAGTSDIVNVSRRLHDGWRNLARDAETTWSSLLFIAAAHNKDETAKLTPEEEREENDDGIPIVWRLPNIMGVGIADSSGKTSKKTLESYRWENVDLLAPGYVVPAVGPTPQQPVCVDGTSYAAGYVSAVAALLQHKAQGALSPSQLRARLLATATWSSEHWDRVKGGLINAHRALDGLFDNVLTFASTENPNKAGLQVTVKLSEEQFEATGLEHNAPRKETQPVFWSDVLRLTKTGEARDASGRIQSEFYMVFVDNGRLRIWKDVTISPEKAAMPITECRRRSDGVRITCDATDVNTVSDYVGQRYRQRDGIRTF